MRRSYGLASRLTMFALASLIVYSSGGDAEGQPRGLLSEREKASILGSDGAAPATCYKLTNIACYNHNKDGNLTSCGQQASTDCGGNVDNFCSRTNTSWECPADKNGDLQKCPNLVDSTETGCGQEMTGGRCYRVTGGCGVIGGMFVNPAVPCGAAHGPPPQGTLYEDCIKAVQGD